MRRSIAITALVIGVVGVLAAGLFIWVPAHCGSWSPFGCDGTDPELTRLIR